MAVFDSGGTLGLSFLFEEGERARFKLNSCRAFDSESGLWASSLLPKAKICCSFLDLFSSISSPLPGLSLLYLSSEDLFFLLPLAE